MRSLLSITILLTSLFLSGCGVLGKKQGEQYEELDPGLVREVRALGNRNWIVIADESFPLHTRRGVRTLLVDKEIPEVLSGVIDVLESQQHVTPVFYRTRELGFVENDAAPGIDTYRANITQALRGHEIRDFQYRYLSVVLEDDSKTFAVLVIKTKTALPYSSIFIELDSGFWDQSSEKKLRSKMEAQDATSGS
ncbi:MAG: RbsD/FucU domain-containing protein [Roseibacillus sp.]